MVDHSKYRTQVPCWDNWQWDNSDCRSQDDHRVEDHVSLAAVGYVREESIAFESGREEREARVDQRIYKIHWYDQPEAEGTHKWFFEHHNPKSPQEEEVQDKKDCLSEP